MGYEAKKTEHAGPKKGNGAYWGPKEDAKKESNRIRRRNARQSIGEELSADGTLPPESGTTHVAYCPCCRMLTTQHAVTTAISRTAALRAVRCERCGSEIEKAVLPQGAEIPA